MSSTYAAPAPPDGQAYIATICRTLRISRAILDRYVDRSIGRQRAIIDRDQ